MIIECINEEDDSLQPESFLHESVETSVDLNSSTFFVERICALHSKHEAVLVHVVSYEVASCSAYTVRLFEWLYVGIFTHFGIFFQFRSFPPRRFRIIMLRMSANFNRPLVFLSNIAALQM